MSERDPTNPFAPTEQFERDKICNCPECGRTHRKMNFGTPPDSPLITLRAELEKAREQIPNEMSDCTIVFEECPEGHGHLRGTNWIKHPCVICERDAALQKINEMDALLADAYHGEAKNAAQRDAANALLQDALCPVRPADLRARIAAHLEKQ